MAGRSIAAGMLAAGVTLCLAARARAIVLDDPDHFQVKNTWSASDLDVPPPLGGLVFSPDGATLYVVGEADGTDSALYAVPVVRDGAGSVTDLGSGTLAFAASAGLDAGLEHGPGGTLFYAYFRTNQLGQRSGGVAGAESVFDLAAHGVPAAVSGLTFSPVRIDPGTNFGRLQISTSFGSALLEVPLAPTNGVFPPQAASTFVTLPLTSVAGLQYIPAGTFAGDLIYANFDEGQLRVLAIDASGLPIDAQSGAPTLGTSSPLDRVFATDLGVGPLGLEFDARTGDDLFVTTFGGSPADSVIQIGGFAGTFATTTTSTTTSTSLTTEPPSTSTSATTASTIATTTSTTATTSSTSSSTVVSTSTSSVPTTSTVSTTTVPSTVSTTTTSSTSTSLQASTTSSSVSGTSSSSTTSSSVTTSTAPGSSSTTTTSVTSTTAPDASTTTIASTSTSTSSLGPPTTTSTSVTTSTLPPVLTPTTTTIPPACVPAPTFESIRCQLAELARRVDESRLVIGPLEGPLVRRVRRAERRAHGADEQAGAGRMRRARRLVGRVAVELRAFEAALASRRGRKVPASVRAQLVDAASVLRTNVRALRAGL